LPITLREILTFFVGFERALAAEAAPGVMEASPRDTLKLIEAFKLYFGGPIQVLGLDFYEGLESEPANEVVDQTIRPDELASLVMYYEKDGAPNAVDILMNTGTYNGRPTFNRCYRRFLVMKEAFHAILKMEFDRQGRVHPDTADTVKWLRLAEKMIYLPFGMPDFDDPDYDDDLKIEHAAELLAILILYPLDRMQSDRRSFLGEADGAASDIEDPEVIAALTLQFATQYRVPQRYVDLMFRWNRFTDVHLLYAQLRDGY
jgi:hypothetical protein